MTQLFVNHKNVSNLSVKEGYLRINDGLFRRAILSDLLDSIEELRIKKTKELSPSDDDYRKNVPYEMEEFYTLNELYKKISSNLEGLVQEFPDLEDFQILILPELSKLLELDQDIKQLLNYFYHIARVLNTFLDGWKESGQNTSELIVKENTLYLLVQLKQDENLDTNGAKELSNSEYLCLISHLSAELRNQDRFPTCEERLAIRLAYELLAKGQRFEAPIIPWGNSGFRDIQTYASITDPGIGHLYGTLRSDRYLEGVIVHIEHLERGSDQDREAVEPYRIPNFNIIGKVKLNVGSHAPSSSYVGRPIFESDFKPSVLKTVHTLAAACSAIFMDGLTECKLAIERMTASEAIEFMKYMSGNVRRDRHTQALSAAFNINTPILDDRKQTLKNNNGQPKLVTERFEIGMLGIELVKEGGFDKVTWDGTANSYPSKCIIEQLTFSEALTLVHKAHEAGLLTYFSAGFRFHHLPQVLYTGVDGIGLGGAQILRYMDKETGYHGPFKEENISTILEIREQAMKDIEGRAAILLSRLDRMYFERSITPEDNQKRELLFTQLRDNQAAQLEETIYDLAHIAALPIDSSHPLVTWAQRLIAGKTNSLAAREFDQDQWSKYLAFLQTSIDKHDYEKLAEQLLSIQNVNKKAAPKLLMV